MSESSAEYRQAFNAYVADPNSRAAAEFPDLLLEAYAEADPPDPDEDRRWREMLQKLGGQRPAKE